MIREGGMMGKAYRKERRYPTLRSCIIARKNDSIRWGRSRGYQQRENESQGKVSQLCHYHRIRR